jgi:hypothetical protein
MKTPCGGARPASRRRLATSAAWTAAVRVASDPERLSGIGEVGDELDDLIGDGVDCGGVVMPTVGEDVPLARERADLDARHELGQRPNGHRVEKPIAACARNHEQRLARRTPPASSHLHVQRHGWPRAQRQMSQRGVG